MKSMILGLVTAQCITSFSVGSAMAGSWTCQNNEFEISCSDAGCVESEGFTPMSVSVRPDEISLCAYTGCWSGAPAAVLRSGGLETFIGDGLVWSHDPDSTAQVVVAIDPEASAATILVAGLFATPATCQPD